MSGKTEKKFGEGEMFFGFIVGLIIDGIAFLGDAISVGFGGWIVQGFLWPAIKMFWLNKGGGSVLNDPLKGYLVPILVQGLPFLPTMCATILVVMVIENRSSKSGIINKAVRSSINKTISTTKIDRKTTPTTNSIEIKPETGVPLSNSNKPRILSMPSSPIRTQNNPIIQEYKKENEEQETINKAA